MVTRGEGTTRCVGSRAGALKRECLCGRARRRLRSGPDPVGCRLWAAGCWADASSRASRPSARAAHPRNAPPDRRARCRARRVLSAGSVPSPTSRLWSRHRLRAIRGHAVVLEYLAQLLDVLLLGVLVRPPALLG